MGVSVGGMSDIDEDNSGVVCDEMVKILETYVGYMGGWFDGG